MSDQTKKSDKKKQKKPARDNGAVATLAVTSSAVSSETQTRSDKVATPTPGYEEVAFTAAAIPAVTVDTAGNKIIHTYDDMRFEDEGEGIRESPACDLNPNVAYDTHTPPTSPSSVPAPALPHPAGHEEELIRSDGDYQYPDLTQGKKSGKVRNKFTDFVSSIRKPNLDKVATSHWYPAGVILVLISIVVAILSLLMSIVALSISSKCNCNLSNSSPQMPSFCTSTVITRCMLEGFCETPTISTGDEDIASSILGCTVSTSSPTNDSVSATLLTIGDGYVCQCITGTSTEGVNRWCNLVAVRC